MGISKEVILAVKQMYNVNTLDKVPLHVLVALDDTSMLCSKAGGELVSRQVIASIIVENDKLKCYDVTSEHYIGD